MLSSGKPLALGSGVLILSITPLCLAKIRRPYHWMIVGCSLVALILVIRNSDNAQLPNPLLTPIETKLEFKWLTIFHPGDSPNIPARGIIEITSHNESLENLRGWRLGATLNLEKNPYRGSHWIGKGVLQISPEAVMKSSKQPNPIIGIFNRGIASPLEKSRAFTRIPANWRHEFGSGIQGSDSRGRSFLRALTLGERFRLERSVNLSLLQTGTMHFFAISGLHIGFLAGGLFLIFKACRLPYPITVGFLIVILLLYLAILDYPPSAVRAVIMTGCFLIAGCLNRQNAAILGLCLSVSVNLLIWPGQLYSLGFQLSHLVVAGILLHAEPLRWMITFWLKQKPPRPEKFQEPRLPYKIGQFFLSMFCVSWAAFIMSAPLIMNRQEGLPWIGIVLNFPLYFLIAGALTSAFVGIFFWILSWQSPSELCFNIGGWILEGAFQLTSIAHGLPIGFSRASWLFPAAPGLTTLALILALLLRPPKSQSTVVLRLMLPPIILFFNIQFLSNWG